MLDLCRMLRRDEDRHLVVLARQRHRDLAFEVEMILAPDSEAAGSAEPRLRHGGLGLSAPKLEGLKKEPVDVPADLEQRVRDHLAENPTETWDSAVKAIIDEGDDSEERADGGV
jgi:hypothetical protein